jgi:hypothetical protein
MTRHLTAFAAALTVATAVVAAQGNQAPPTPEPSSVQVPADQQRGAPESKVVPEVSLTGCLIQGSGPDVFVLDNAKISAADKAEKGKTYVLWASAEDVNFKTHLNHEVTITGTADAKVAPMPAPGQKASEKDLPKLNAKSVSMIADKCTAPTH